MSKTKITFTDFIDLALRVGTQKVTKIKELKSRGEYSPAKDFYKQVRDIIIETHTNDLPKDYLDNAFERATEKKKTHFQAIVKGYKKWWGNKNLEWIEPPRATIDTDQLLISINPELYLDIDGEKHIIKLYLKDDKLTKNKILHTCQMMHDYLKNDLDKNTYISIIDVRRGVLHTPSTDNSIISTVLRGELQLITTIWNDI